LTQTTKRSILPLLQSQVVFTVPPISGHAVFFIHFTKEDTFPTVQFHAVDTVLLKAGHAVFFIHVINSGIAPTAQSHVVLSFSLPHLMIVSNGGPMTSQTLSNISRIPNQFF